MKVIKLNQKAVSKAIKVIMQGGVVVFPTDTVYGFLASALNKKAVDRIFAIKKRKKSKPMAIFVKDIRMAKKLAEISEHQEKILKRYWPGKITVVLKGKPGMKLYGVKKNTIEIRIKKYKFLNDLLKKINKPLAQTSVNISGELFLIKINDIIKKFGRYKDVLIISAGNLKKSKPSKILDLTGKNKKILRHN